MSIIEGTVGSADRKYLVVRPDIDQDIDMIINEYNHMEELKSIGIPNSNKILLTGTRGTGKTMTALTIAKELGLMVRICTMERALSGHPSIEELKSVFDCPFEPIDKMMLLLTGIEKLPMGSNSYFRDLFCRLVAQYDPNQGLLIVENSDEYDYNNDYEFIRIFDKIIDYCTPSDEEGLRVVESVLMRFGLPVDVRERIYDFIRDYYDDFDDTTHELITRKCIEEIRKSVLDGTWEKLKDPEDFRDKALKQYAEDRVKNGPWDN
jgi:AAA+ superfamily predicted ATPase